MLLRGDAMNRYFTVKKSVLLLCRTGILASLALVLSFFESMLPSLPFLLPGMKLGLSNLAVMLALDMCPLPCALCIVAVKSLFALMSRGVVASAMSLFGGLLATIGMFFMLKCKKCSFGCFGLGVGGAFLHNCGQFVAALFLASDAVCAYFPVLAVGALVTGSVTGLVYYFVLPVLKKLPLMGA